MLLGTKSIPLLRKLGKANLRDLVVRLQGFLVDILEQGIPMRTKRSKSDKRELLTSSTASVKACNLKNWVNLVDLICLLEKPL